MQQETRLVETIVPHPGAAHALIDAVNPNAYARTRNAIDGAVSGLSPYITHGFVTVPQVLAGVRARHSVNMQHKFVYELGWREFFRHVWRHRGDAILTSLHEGPLPEDAYARELPDDIRQGRSGVPVIDEAVRSLYATGTLHNHARMWLASYVVHVRKVHWRAGADWLYGHLLDGDLASNHLSWQWVAGTGSSKPYLFNAENVARYAPQTWHSAGTVIDTSYEVLDALARTRGGVTGRDVMAESLAQECDDRIETHRLVSAEQGGGAQIGHPEPASHHSPPGTMGFSAPDAAAVAGRDVWLVHPWMLGDLPDGLPADGLVVCVLVTEFHHAWPWSERRWHFVATRMAALGGLRWQGDAASIGRGLAGARRVRSITEPHLSAWLPAWAECIPMPALFPELARPCSSFSQWWTRVSRAVSGAKSA